MGKSKKSETNTEVIELEAEEVIDIDVVSKEIDSKIEKEVVKHNVTEAVLNSIEKKYMPMALKDLEDKAGYEEIRAARIEVKSLRVKTTAWCKRGRELAILEQRRWKAKEDSITSRLSSVEEHLQTEEDKFEAEKLRKKAEKEEADRKRRIGRTSALTLLGAAFIGSDFILQNASVDAEFALNCDQEIFDNEIFPPFKAEFDRINAEKLAEQEKQQKEKEEMDAKMKELEESQKKLADLQKKIQEDKEREEKARVEKIYTERVLKIQEEGGVIITQDGRIIHKESPTLVYPETVSRESISVIEPSDVAIFINSIKAFMAGAYNGLQEKKRIEAAQALAKQLQEKKEQEERELAVKNDSEKWKTVVAYLRECPMPEMVSGPYRGKMRVVKDFLSDLK